MIRPIDIVIRVDELGIKYLGMYLRLTNGIVFSGLGDSWSFMMRICFELLALNILNKGSAF
jgi:hypothetical protein